MKSLRITLLDGSSRTVDEGSTVWDLAKLIGKRLEADAVAAIVDGQTVDLSTPLRQDATVQIVTRDSKEGLEVIRHSTAHLLAQAIKELFPTAQITIGPVIEDGFYYDIDCPKKLAPEDLPIIEKKMTEIAARAMEVTRKDVPKKEAIAYFKDQKENFKAEIIEGIPDPTVSVYSQGGFTDLCRGPHVPNTSRLGKFKLLSVAGAYWRGDEKNTMLQRIYGTAWPTQKELDEHLNRIEEAKKRDHRKLGPELELFTFIPEVAPAMPFYLAKGTTLFNSMADFMRKEIAPLGYQEVICPQVMTSALWEISGHLENYRENMFLIQEDKVLHALKPMNCPGHCQLFASTKRSYRELPLRFAEFTKLHRNERAGVTHGLLRTRAFSQDDGHIFCSLDQIGSEAATFLTHTLKIYRKFGFNEVQLKLATRPEKYLGTLETWSKAESLLEEALRAGGYSYEFARGEAVFYGPKIEFHIRDSLKRYWQCGTIQLDFNLPERFRLEYIDKDNSPKRPVMLHRAVLGSLERFMGVLIEHHAGHLPLWISPVQATVINVSEDQKAYGESVLQRLREKGVRVEMDARNEKLGYRIREAQLKKIPLMLVVGEKEKTAGAVSVRQSSGATTDLSFENFLHFFHKQLQEGEA